MRAFTSTLLALAAPSTAAFQAAHAVLRRRSAFGGYHTRADSAVMLETSRNNPLFHGEANHALFSSPSWQGRSRQAPPKLKWLIRVAALSGVFAAVLLSVPLRSTAAQVLTEAAAQPQVINAALTQAMPPPTVTVTSPMSTLSELKLTCRLLFAALAGATVGKERSSTSSNAAAAAGVRTMALVSLGAAAFTMCSMYGFAGCGNKFDPSRMASNVASGVGFIGAGVITTTHSTATTQSRGGSNLFQHPNETLVHGLTTAAAVWLSAAVGVASGVGLYILASGAAALTIGILRFGRGIGVGARRVVVVPAYKSQTAFDRRREAASAAELRDLLYSKRGYMPLSNETLAN